MFFFKSKVMHAQLKSHLNTVMTAYLYIRVTKNTILLVFGIIVKVENMVVLSFHLWIMQAN